MNTTATQKTETTNSLKHKIWTKDAEGNDLVIDIRLNDECKNGHQDFAITATGWQKGKPHVDKYMVYGGCCHEAIVKACPDLQIFVDLYLCDYLGNPMHCCANGFYHLTNGLSNAATGIDKFKTEFCEYYRITPVQFDRLNESKNKVQYYNIIQELKVPNQWKKQADAGIKLLEQMTGKSFLIDSKRTQMDKPTLAELLEETERQENGYYTKEAEENREVARIGKIVAKLEAERDKEISASNLEFTAKMEVLKRGGSKALENIIFYNHTNEIAFNWRGYDNLSEEFINDLISKLELPEGVTAKINKK